MNIVKEIQVVMYYDIFLIFWNSFPFYEEEKKYFTDQPTLLFLGWVRGNKLFLRLAQSYFKGNEI